MSFYATVYIWHLLTSVVGLNFCNVSSARESGTKMQQIGANGAYKIKYKILHQFDEHFGLKSKSDSDQTSLRSTKLPYLDNVF